MGLFESMGMTSPNPTDSKIRKTKLDQKDFTEKSVSTGNIIGLGLASEMMIPSR